MATNPRPLAALIDHVSISSSGRAGRARCAQWGKTEPVLAGYPTAALLAETIRRSAPSGQDGLLTALLSVAAYDELAQLTAVAGLTRRLGAVVVRWQRAGVPQHEVCQLEADLVAECWTAVTVTSRRMMDGGDPPPASGMALVQMAWEAVRSPRRRERRREVRLVPVGEITPMAENCERDASVELAAEIVSAVRSGRVSIGGARLVFSTRVAGLSVVETAARLGCTPQSVRTRRARVERRLTAAA